VFGARVGDPRIAGANVFLKVRCSEKKGAPAREG
jgi:hypothetical protein